MSQTKPNKVDHVRARFGGRDLVFKIPRDQLEGFEAAIGSPAGVRLAQIVAGRATAAEIREVLEYAAPAGLGRRIPTTSSQILAAAAFRGADMSAISNHKPSVVAQTLSANPPARYTILAQGVLAACLYGIPEDAASFDEDEEPGETDGYGNDAA